MGDVIDALDTANKWYESTIRDVKPDKILVHYEGWESRWDAWIDRDSPNLAPKNTHTTGPYQVQFPSPCLVFSSSFTTCK